MHSGGVHGNGPDIRRCKDHRGFEGSLRIISSQPCSSFRLRDCVGWLSELFTSPLVKLSLPVGPERYIGLDNYQ